MESKTIIVIKESLMVSIARDLFSCGSLLACVGVGVWVGSDALQWIAGLFWVIFAGAGGATMFGSRAYTVEQARAKLDEIEKEM